MADHFLTRTDITARSMVAAGDTPVLLQADALRDLLAGQGFPDLTGLFAQPLLSAEAPNGSRTVSWYSDFSGTPRRLADLDGAVRADVAERLSALLDQLRAIPQTAADSDLVNAALMIGQSQDDMVVGGRPVLINWGTAPEEVAASPTAREAHFGRTLGYVLAGTSPGLGAATPVVGATAEEAPVVEETTVTDPAAPPPPATPVQAPAPATPPPPKPFALLWPLAALCAVLALLVLWLLLPHTRLFPPQAEVAGIDLSAEAEEIAREVNRDLEQRIASLQAALNTGVCTPEGAFILPDGRTPDGLLPPITTEDATLDPADPAPLIPPTPERVQIPAPTDGADGTTLPAQTIVQVLEERTVLVIAESASGVSVGTGFFIGPSTVFTNHHVVAEGGAATRILVVNDTFSSPAEARIVVTDGPFEQTGADFAILEVPGADAAYFSLLDAGIEVKGQAVIAAGYPMDIVGDDVRFQDLMEGRATEAPDLVITNGTVNTEQQIFRDISVLIHSASISRGNSGGPLVDMCGRVVGMNTFVSEQSFRFLNIAQSMAGLREFLESSGVDLGYETAACSPVVLPVAPAEPEPAEDPAEDPAEE